MIECICAFCGKPILRVKSEVIRNKTGKFYCSPQCHNLGSKKNIKETTCPVCGKNFHLKPSRRNERKTGPFCSRECFSKSKLITCPICGKEFYREPWFVKKHKTGTFCSVECRSKSDEYKKQVAMSVSKVTKGELNPMYGRSGKLSPAWRGGPVNKGYCPKFNEDLRESVREAFGRRCYLCGKTEADDGRRLAVHHVDYMRSQGCGQRWSLIPLCLVCHAKTTASSNRHYYFNRLINYWLDKYIENPSNLLWSY